MGLIGISVLLGVSDLDVVGHDDSLLTNLLLDISHDFNLDSEDTLSKLDVSAGFINELLLGVSSRDQITLLVFHGFCSLSSDLSRDDNFATLSLTSLHDSGEDVVSSKSNWGSVQKLELDGLALGGSAEVSVVGNGLDSELNLVVLIVEVVSLLDEGLKLSDLSGFGVEDFSGLGSLDSNLSGHAGGSHLNSGISVSSEASGKELMELSLEDTIGNELLLGIHSSDFSFNVGHLRSRLFNNDKPNSY